MAALFKQFFKNRKQRHDTPGKPKTEPVARLDPAKENDLKRLNTIAVHGETNEERQSAIARHTDAAFLVELHVDAPANLRGAITQRVTELARQNPEAVNASVGTIKTPEAKDLLKQLISSTTQTPEELLKNATSEQLVQYATQGQTATIRRAAAERITVEQDLQAVQKASRGRDKGVYQLAKQKLQALRTEEAEKERIAADIDRLIREAESLSRTQDTKLFDHQLDRIRQHWAQNESSATAAQHHEFLEALSQCRDRQKAFEAEAQEVRRLEEKQNERKATLSLLRDTLNDLQNPDTENHAEPSLSALDALQKTQENRWLEATRDADVDRQEQKDYQALMLGLRGYIGARQRLEQSGEQVQALLAEEAPAPRQLSELLHTIDWPADFPEPQPVKALRKQAGEVREARKAAASDQKAQQRALDDLLDRLETSLEENRLKESQQLHRQAQQAFDRLDRNHSANRQARLNRLGRQVLELRDWQGFATRPKQQELCEAMEYLADQHMEPEAKAERIHELQQEWRELGGSSDQTLWQRFKKAGDEAFAPCQEYFAAKSDLKMTNVRTREAICEQLSGFIDGVDWNQVDWKAVERIHRVARREWREAWPVDFKANRPVQKRFDRLLKTIGEPLDAERQRNEGLKADIVRRAESLISHEPLPEAMQQAKDLQKEWEQVGLTRHREDRQLWKAFRAACDQIFARRDQAKAIQEDQDKEAIKELERRIEASRATRQSQSSSLAALEQEQKQLTNTPVPRSTPNMLRSELESEQTALRQMIAGLQRAAKAERLKREIDTGERSETAPSTEAPHPLPSPETIVVGVEVVTGSPSPDHAQEARMAYQVERLASGMSGGSENRSEDAEVESLIQAWCESPEAGSNPEHVERLYKAIDHWAEINV